MAEGEPPRPGAHDNPWTVRSTSVRYENTWIRVDHHEVITPGGRDGIYGVVHAKNVAVGAIPLDHDGDIWVVGQYRFPLARYEWEIPEGGSPPDTTPLDSAKRELLEETGIVARQWDKLLEMDLSNSFTDEHAIVYLARDLSFSRPTPEDTERLEVRKVPFETFYREVLDGRHHDSMTVAGILRLKLLLQDGLAR